MNNLNYEELEKLCQEKSRERRKGILAFFGFLLAVSVILLTINIIKDGNWEVSKMIITMITIILLIMYLLFVFLSKRQRLKRYLKDKPNASAQEAYEFIFKDDG